jgi:alpha-1,2-mannosyltransferase
MIRELCLSFVFGCLSVRKTSGIKVSEKLPDTVLMVGAFGTLAMAVWLYVNFGSDALSAIFSDSMYVHTDFDTFWRSAEALWAGKDTYNTEAWLFNMNPPVWTLLISPLGFLDPLTAYRVFVLVTLLISVGSLVWMAYELRLRIAWAAVGIVMLLLSAPMLDTLRLGQIYPVLALGLVAAWVADRHDKPLLSGCALGLTVAVKPSLAPVLLWPLMRRQWGMLGASVASGVVATLVGVIVVGPQATLDWLRLLTTMQPDGYWENASLPAAAVRLFSVNQYTDPVAILPWTMPVANILAGGILILTAAKVRRDSEMAFWALVAASLLVSPIAWYRYLVLLGPSILLLMARGSVAPAFLLLALQLMPSREWAAIWQDTSAMAPAHTLYLFILLAYWFVLLPTVREAPAHAPEPHRS